MTKIKISVDGFLYATDKYFTAWETENYLIIKNKEKNTYSLHGKIEQGALIGIGEFKKEFKTLKEAERAAA